MDAPVKAGDIIDGRYRLERVIGTGGMAVVVAAIDIEVEERVALKFLFKKAARHKEILQRFEREQAVISRLEGDHVARMLNSGVVKNTPYMVMEYLQGRDLQDLLRVQKTLPLEQAVEYVLQACDAVAEAHSLDIVHRDLKPGNLFLTHRADGSPCIKVVDFGIAKILSGGDGEGSLTRTEVVMGSPFYMSPEQMVSSKDVGPATDIWALGVILYELLAGKIPFAEKTTEKVCSRVLSGDHTPLREVFPNCPDGLDEVVARCLTRMPADRYRDVAELAAALEAYAPSQARFLIGRARFRLNHPGQTPPEQETAPELAPERDPEEAREAPTVYLPRKPRNRWKPILFAAFGGGMLALGFAGGMFFRGQAPDADPSSSLAAHATPSAEPVVTSVPTEEATGEDDEEPVVPEVPIEIDLDELIRKSDTENRRNAPPRSTRGSASSVSPASSKTAPPLPSSPPSSTKSAAPVVPASAKSPPAGTMPTTTSVPSPTATPGTVTGTTSPAPSMPSTATTATGTSGATPEPSSSR